MQQVLAIGLGEILWDVLPDSRLLGGAPANFAYQVNALGCAGVPVSRVGDDELGREALAVLATKGVMIEGITVDTAHPTGTVDARIDGDGVATYVFPDDVAWDFLTVNETILDIAAKADAICFGTLAQRSAASRQAVREVLEASPKSLKVYDINLRQEFYTEETIRASLKLADVLKINDDELQVVAKMLGFGGGEEKVLAALVESYDLEMGVLTSGGDGSLILTPEDRSEIQGREVEVVDTIGAGDSFTAALVLGRLAGLPLDEINRRAAEVAAYVCSQPGAMPNMPQELRFD